MTATTTDSPQRTRECLSFLVLDSLRADELSAPEVQAARKHLLDCVRCQTRMASVEADAARFIEAAPRFEKIRKPVGFVAAFGRSKTATLAVTALAMAAALFVYVRARPVQEANLGVESLREGVRLKGGHRIGFFVKRGAAVSAGSTGDVVFPGDVLRFTATVKGTGTSAGSTYLAIFSVDGAHHASIYHPSGERSERIDTAAELPLGSSIELDEVLGEEQIYGVFCPTPIVLEPYRRALEGAAGATATSFPPECSVDHMTIVKRARP